MAKNDKIAPAESSSRRSSNTKNSLFSGVNLRTVAIGGALVLAGFVGGQALDHRLADGDRTEHAVEFGATLPMMGDMMDDDTRGGAPEMGMGFGGGRDHLAGTVVSVTGDQLVVNTVNGNVTLTIGSETTYTATSAATIADLVVGSTIQIHLDESHLMQTKEIVIAK